ncbi:hypothetical protein DFQ27_000167 [Actinomortierella ambigua]|uniref:F-box domain-containing protein n=1 Tax=Actinomortierella ambigua TaxID=1343610 RepID=A0A9P6QFP6_9FUNG|nr:hypothetical protein DFQ27_000167 [Actinomortierella ambigua]
MDRLPPEIALTIARCFVDIQGQRSLAACNRLNKQWHQWTLPMLYHTPQIESLRALESFLITVFESTRHLYVQSHLEKEFESYVLDGVARKSVLKGVVLAQREARAKSRTTMSLASTSTTTTKVAKPHGNVPLGHYVREVNLAMIPHRWDQINGFRLWTLCRGCPFLERLDLRDCWHLREEELWCSILGSPTLPYTLKSLTLSECYLISDTTISLACDFLQSLEQLELSYCELLSDRTLYALANIPETPGTEEQRQLVEPPSEEEYRLCFDRLSFLATNYMSMKTGQFPTHPARLPTNVDSSDPEAYTTYAGRMPWLPPMPFSSLSGDDAESPKRPTFSRPRVHKTLKHLDISRCMSITDDGIRVLREGIEQLQSLNIQGCYGVLMTDDEDLPGVEWEDIDDDVDEDDDDDDDDDDDEY